MDGHATVPYGPAVHARLALTAAAAVALTAGAGLAPRSVQAATEPPSPANGHAQVVATGLIPFEDGPFHWQLTPNPATPEPTPLAADGPLFIVSDGPSAVIVSDDDGPVARLAAGEALFRPDGVTSVLETRSPDGGDGAAIAAVAGPGEGEFTPGAGIHDVDLVRDVLGTNEVLLVRSDVSVFIVVTAGSVTIGDATVAAGSTAAEVGDITIINTSPETATVLATVVGPRIDGTADAATEVPPATGTLSPQPGGTASPGGSTGTTATTEPPTTTTTTSTTTTTTEAPAPVDTDSDGLSDTDEAALGTDPNNQDSDGDGIPDGREVNALGSNPLDTDTDSDGLTDALEVDHSCGINTPDSDGDGLGDAFEANSGFSECSLADTDGDGDDDLAEFSLGTDPRDPNCFSGPGSVCPV